MAVSLTLHETVRQSDDALPGTPLPPFHVTRLRVTLEGRAYDVLVEELGERKQSPHLVPTAAHPLESAAPSFGAAPHVLAAGPGVEAARTGAVLCPLSGKVVSIDVRAGDGVLEGAQVATIEAMKMNTYVFAPLAGQVTAINAAPGDLVEEGAVLLRLVPPKSL